MALFSKKLLLKNIKKISVISQTSVTKSLLKKYIVYSKSRYFCVAIIFVMNSCCQNLTFSLCNRWHEGLKGATFWMLLSQQLQLEYPQYSAHNTHGYTYIADCFVKIQKSIQSFLTTWQERSQ